MLRTVMLIVVGCAGSAAGQVQVIVPGAQATIEGSIRNAFPFAALTPISQRYQQVHGAGEFQGIGGPHRITALRFRPDATFAYPPWSNDVMLEVRFSVTQAGPDGLSNTFANNIGAGELLVYSGPATISTMQTGPAPGPMEFDVLLTLQTPYEYDPAQGHLLMDVVREGATLTTPRYLDAENVVGDGVSRLYSTVLTTSSSPTGNLDSLGLVIMFIMEPAVEPCYANCDASTTAPILNVEDFTCFINEFAAATQLPHQQQLGHYANCDQSTTAPALNVEDFTCFINKFAQGCR
jgi:hypothetical protein